MESKWFFFCRIYGLITILWWRFYFPCSTLFAGRYNFQSCDIMLTPECVIRHIDVCFSVFLLIYCYRRTENPLFSRKSFHVIGMNYRTSRNNKISTITNVYHSTIEYSLQCSRKYTDFYSVPVPHKAEIPKARDTKK